MDKDYDKQVETAYNQHISGQLNEAKQAYEFLLEKNPDDLEVKNLYAQLSFTLKDYALALKLFLEVYEKTGIEDIKVNIFKSYLMLHDYENALKYGLEVYNTNEKDKSICMYLSSIYKELNDKENQLKYLIKAAEIEPDVNILYTIGVLYTELGDNENALEAFKAVCNLHTGHKYALLNIAQIFKNYDKNVTIKIYEELAEKYPDDLNLLSQLYIVYIDIMNFNKAYEISEKLIKLAPEKNYPYSFAGDALYNLGRYEQAIEMFEKEFQLTDNSDNYSIYMIAKCYSIMNDGKKAIELLKTKYKGDLNECSGYGYLQLKEKNLEEGRFYVHNSLTYFSDKEEIVEKKAIELFYKLNIGKKYGINEADFKTLKKYRKNDLDIIRPYLKKDLFGHNSDNKRVLLYHAQGVGDIIMFSRYIHLLENHTKNILIQIPKSMRRLMEYNFPQYEIFDNDKTIDENLYDYSCSYHSLLVNLKEVTLHNIPFSSKYLDIDEKLVKEKSKLNIMKNNKKKIGIYWMGNPQIMPQRSIKLDELKPLFEIKNSQIYSFQISNLDNDSEEQKNELPLIDLAPYIKDYADTAAFLKNIDVLVTVDTSIANLAGAMGIKTFLLLIYESEWRWFHDENITPWYDSVRIFKQKTPFVWDDVIERVKNELNV